MNDKLWEPSPQEQFKTTISRFMQQTGVGYYPDRLDYDELWRYSIADVEGFWNSVWDFCAIKGTKGKTVLQASDHIRDFRFFPDGRINYAENLLSRTGTDKAIVFFGEGDHQRDVTWDELWTKVAAVRAALVKEGVTKGDVVGGIVTNSPEAVMAMLAVTSLGAVWSSCSPDFGLNGILDRFGQIEPKIIFGVEGYHYDGKWFETGRKCQEVQTRIAATKRLVLLPYNGVSFHPSTELDQATPLADFTGSIQPSPVDFVKIPFSSPLFILFSSGTTGKPKCIIHSVGGTILQHKKEHLLHGNIAPGDRILFFTTCGWMMWNWLVSALASQATIILYDGSPVHPGVERLCQIIEECKINQLGASAKYFETCAKVSFRPKGTYDLTSLRTVFSTGSPLVAEIFDYLYADWKNDFCVSSMSGGTDILGCFVGGSHISPVYRGQCQKRMLGMDVRVYDENGSSVEEKPGELVCLSPHPTIPVGFFGDVDNEKLNAAYFDRFPRAWHHGDWVELTKEGGMIFFGRSDATLNPGGVRIGTSEIYRPVEQMPEVIESLVIARDVGSDVELLLFVKLADGCVLDNAMRTEIRNQIRTNASPRHVPARIVQVDDLPRTRSGKLVELAVRELINGREIKNIEALANPEALEQFRQLREELFDIKKEAD